ncbi:uncharacterized protein LOC143452219 [Clavelina lepadiformis]|uniref:uncharacterized protein LOC143452219 n=1 Tax=Clavelina lepadiformis TaxID=159417 RepID=UPI0040417D51
MKVTMALFSLLLFLQPGADALFGNFKDLLLENLSNNIQQARCRTDCRDYHPSCLFLRSKCLASLSAIFLRRVCPLSCKICKACPKRTPGCQEEPCIDTDQFCFTYQKENLCHLPYVVKNCQRSCKLCATECSLPSPTDAPCDPACKDDYHYCARWKAKGYCDALTGGYPHVLFVCKKTCTDCKPCLPTYKSGEK